MSETAPRALPPGLTPVTEARHYGFLKASIPQYLVEAKPEHRAALKSTGLSKSGWYGALTPASKGQLKPLLEARFTSQNRMDQHLSKVLPLEAFAQPLLDAALKAAGLPEGFRWHDLRHTWASWHAQDGTPLHVLQELGGWASAEMVQRYAHLSTQHLAHFVDRRVGLKLVGGTDVFPTVQLLAIKKG